MPSFQACFSPRLSLDEGKLIISFQQLVLSDLETKFEKGELPIFAGGIETTTKVKDYNSTNPSTRSPDQWRLLRMGGKIDLSLNVECCYWNSESLKVAQSPKGLK